MPTLILVGPTAAGKTGVIHELARRHRAPVISADAMLIYRGMNIGTAKPPPEDLAAYHYQGVDLAHPGQAFSVHDYLRAIRPVAGAMIAGGTGLYVRALRAGLDAAMGEDPVWRALADETLARDGFDALKALCRARDPAMDEALPVGDRENPRRWIRHVERVQDGGAGLPPLFAAEDTVVVGLLRAREDLQARIQRRVARMFAEGLLDEVRGLRANAGTFSLTAAKAIGYAEAAAVLDGTMSEAKAREAVIIRTRQYAKRQLTWFRHQLPVRWIEVQPDEEDGMIATRVEKIWHG